MRVSYTGPLSKEARTLSSSLMKFWKLRSYTHPGGSSRISLQTAGVEETFPRESTTALEPVPSFVSIHTATTTKNRLSQKILSLFDEDLRGVRAIFEFSK